MNPDENQPQATGPEPVAPTPEAPSPAPENLSTSDQADVASALDQLAADAVAAANDAAAAPAPAAEPVTTEPTPGTPAPDIAAAVTEMDADAVLDSLDSPETTPEHSIPNAIGVDAVASASEAASLAAENASAEGSEGDAKIVSEDESDAKEEPIQPADPVPGSIGSAINYSETAPNHAEANEKPKFSLFSKKPKAEESSVPAAAPVSTAEPVAVNINHTSPVSEMEPEFPNSMPGSVVGQDKNKKNSIILALIIIGAVILIGAIVFIIVFIMTSAQNKPTTTTSTSVEEVETVESSLICSRTSTAEDISNSANKSLASYDLKMIANYTDDELIDISFTGTYNYTTEEAASEGARQSRLAYVKEYEKLGLREDPFSSNYPVNGTSFSASHFAEFDELDEDNAALFFLTANSRGAVITDKEAVRKIYVGRGYTCSGDEDEEEIDDTAIEDDTDTTTDDTVDDYDEEYDEDYYYDEDDIVFDDEDEL